LISFLNFSNLLFLSYFTELAEELPDDTLILTLGCAKNRFIRSEKLMGKTLSNGMPRILDMGQCNDSYSAVVVATELAKALNCTVNDLPLSVSDHQTEFALFCMKTFQQLIQLRRLSNDSSDDFHSWHSATWNRKLPQSC
jgi:hypothetical protein